MIYAARVDILPGVLLLAQVGRRSKNYERVQGPYGPFATSI